MTAADAATADDDRARMAATLVDRLQSSLRGPLLLPHDAGFEEARTVWNAMIDRKPAAVARCLGTAAEKDRAMRVASLEVRADVARDEVPAEDPARCAEAGQEP